MAEPAPIATGADWECLECGYDRAESKGLPKPSICPICAGDTGRDGHLVYKAPPLPTSPTIHCACARWGYDDETCVCSPEERWARNLIAGTPGTPQLTMRKRQLLANRTARVEGYPRADVLLELSDRDLAQQWMNSMIDYCRDKGLIP